MRSLIRTTALLWVLLALPALAAERPDYKPAKVVYDVSSADPQRLNNILDRVSLLQTMYAGDPFTASIVIVLHEGGLPLFAKSNAKRQGELVARARDLAAGEIVRFRLCEASARMQGFGRKDFDDYIELVPMADAEIIRLQHDGYAYLN